MEINVVNEEEMNLLGLLLKKMIEKNLNETTENLEKLNNKKIFIQAGKMKVILDIRGPNIEIKRVYGLEGANAKISGSFDAFIKVATSKNRFIPFLNEFLLGNIKVGGNPLNLLPLVKVLKIK